MNEFDLINKLVIFYVIYSQFLMSDIKTANPRIPSPLTGAIADL